jgi:hypothetical protein
MEPMRATWTDSRLDDLANRVDAGFARVDEDIREMRGEIGSLQRTIIQVGGALGAGFIALLAAMLGLIATQL